MRVFLTDIHKNIFGKGPEEVWVKVESDRNVICFTIKQTSLHIEEYLDGIPDLKEDWINLRKKIVKHEEKEIFAQFKKITGFKPIKLVIDFDTSTNITFGMFLFKKID